MTKPPVNILLLEDEAPHAALIRRAFESHAARFRLAVAGSLHEARELLKNVTPDLVIADLLLPDGKGTELLSDQPDTKRFPLVVLTAHGDEQVAVEAMKAGALDYVVKSGDSLAAMPHIAERSLREWGHIVERKRAEEALRKAHAELEIRVNERTKELGAANEQLRREIADRERAELAARKSEERLRAIIETARDCIYIKDRNLRYTFVNPSMEQLLGIRSAEIVGKTDRELFGAVAGEHLVDVEYRVLQGAFIEEEHTRPIRGSKATFLDLRAPMRNREGQVIGICGISRNITERREPRTWVPETEESTASPVMRQTMAEAMLAAQSDSIILLMGESGCGKDYLARVIHNHSKRAGGPFFAINCAAVAPELAESELFGHEAGAFTGAAGRKRGLLELAEGGSLLLNEIGELAPTLQAKLLTFLDTRTFTRVGGNKTVSVSARIMAATNRELAHEVQEGRFRKDLYYRLNVMAISIPPLRDRIEDIPSIAKKILAQLSTDLQLPRLPELDTDALREFASYHWPGNIRELRNVLERALIISKGGRLDPPQLRCAQQTNDWVLQMPFPEDKSLNEITKEVKRSIIMEALRRSRGSKKHAASLLKISRYALRRQMQSLGLMGENET